ncbi:hypothetical protein LEMA_P051210.1 [Plenodomus lingam JN3]|uniref:Sterol regulatory element-binding protein cleavage-activating protein n=1 Tax=Leptosphaeria maculans (strain JN3 / isolate v23.1.3 / race Av1-4-5-6-7-8) TaxID=985895 RepID=E4ZM66_LEPMJ|nr:hypothetical protein LEMA_P051210.1 [Plenodomus lingam JN3]CBX92415.1 hypothetical protein LEMA_P051210.1 [Plenodomus lingam JN3]
MHICFLFDRLESLADLVKIVGMTGCSVLPWLQSDRDGEGTVGALCHSPFAIFPLRLLPFGVVGEGAAHWAWQACGGSIAIHVHAADLAHVSWFCSHTHVHADNPICGARHGTAPLATTTPWHTHTHTHTYWHTPNWHVSAMVAPRILGLSCSILPPAHLHSRRPLKIPPPRAPGNQETQSPEPASRALARPTTPRLCLCICDGDCDGDCDDIVTVLGGAKTLHTPTSVSGHALREALRRRMIWLLLYPLRGESEPPKLAASHPIRRAFQAYGTATARHWLISIVLFIVLSFLLCYQAIFQADSAAGAGLRNLPKHVWTSTTEIEGKRPADVVVRQVWVYGDYMKAIDLPVLEEALLVQEVLIGTGFEMNRSEGLTTQQTLIHDHAHPQCIANAAGQGWGWHSPLMYWDCSLRALQGDLDLLATINANQKMQTALNLTLRPSTVFAGKTFSNSKLRAADALVITWFDYSNSSLGELWNSRTSALPHHLSPGWTMFPLDGQVVDDRLYEFRFWPMSYSDDLLLLASYLATAGYVILRMTQLRAVKSWFGLLVTISAKMTICIIASFSLCTYIGIDLSRIPRPWFPTVVFCFGLGNIFRLINVVLETAPEMPPPQRIGHAIGQIGHLSTAIAFQNIAGLYLLSRYVTPWVADFCIFTAVTLVFDFVFHLTFFVAVLSVDVQRMELSDSLERLAHSQATKKKHTEQQSWLARLPTSTRFAGSIGSFSVILALNWHYLNSNGKKLSFHNIPQRFVSTTRQKAADTVWNQPPINQARTPADWLRLQDHNTARELFSFIKPGAQSFVARIYDPLLVIPKGAQGRDGPQPPTSLPEAFRRFAHAHAFPAALILAFLIAGVTLLMNYLLWTGLTENAVDAEDEESMFSVKTLLTPQTTDVVRLASCPKGHIASISLDRTTAIWSHTPDGYSPFLLPTATMKPNLWPINASAIDDGGTQLALCANSGQIGLWNIAAKQFALFPKIDLRGQVPILFRFATLLTRIDAERPYLIIVSPDGRLTELEASTGIHHTKRISSSSIICAKLYIHGRNTSLVYVTKSGEVHILPLREGINATSEVVAGLDPGPPPGSNPEKIKCIEGVPSLGIIFALRDEQAEVFDFKSRALIHSFQIGHLEPHSFRISHPARRLCSCGAPAVRFLSVAYNEEHSNHMIMQTFTSSNPSISQLCLGKSPDHDQHDCQRLDSAHEAVHYVEPAGVWALTSTLSIIGIRRGTHPPSASSTPSGTEDAHYTADARTLASALKHRARKPPHPNTVPHTLDSTFANTRHTTRAPLCTTEWEAWTLSPMGDFRSRPLQPDDLEDAESGFADDHELFVPAPGPISRHGKCSVVVGFGNALKIISLGRETFDGLVAGAEGVGSTGALDLGVGSTHAYRARKGGGRKIQ